MKKLIILLAFLLSAIPSIIAQVPKGRTITDIDSNVYSTLVFGKYEWMTQNLKTTTYNNGVKILNVTDNKVWIGLKSGAYSWYNNDEINAKTYGALYNWYAVNTGNLCPIGWRVPTDKEWKDLEGYIDTKYGTGSSVWDSTRGRGFDVGLRLKSTSGWDMDGNGTDNFGFTALPSGERVSDGRFFIKGKNGFWWSSTEHDASKAWYRCMIYFLDIVLRDIHPKFMGFSVRCIKDK